MSDSNTQTSTGVTRVPQGPAYDTSGPEGYDVLAQPGGASTSTTTNYPTRSVPNNSDKGRPGSENDGLTTTRGYADGATGFNPPVQDATVSSDGRRRVKTISDPGSGAVTRGRN